MTTPPLSHPAHPGARLRRLLDRGCVAMPGAFNGLCARAIAQAGFDACYVSGAATSVCAGVPDVGLLTLEHFCRVIREVADGSRLPVLADADTGFGEAEMVRRTVIEYHRAGGAGLHLEDQKFPKRCGHLDGKELVPVDHMAEKVQWARKASNDCAGGAFIVCARTDARGVEGFDAAVDRARAYVEAGADMIFPEGLTSEAEFEKFAENMRGMKTLTPALSQGEREKEKATQRANETRQNLPPAPHSGRGVYLLANMTEFGKTPVLPLSRFAAMGYSCVIYPVSLLRVAMGAVARALAQLKADGSVAGFLDGMQTRKELYELVEYTPGTPWEARG